MFTAVHSHSPLSGLLMADDSGINRYPAGYSPEPDGSGDKIHRYSIASKSLSFYIIRNKTERIRTVPVSHPRTERNGYCRGYALFLITSLYFLIYFIHSCCDFSASSLAQIFVLRLHQDSGSQAPCRFYGSAPVLNHPAVRMPDQCFL